MMSPCIETRIIWLLWILVIYNIYVVNARPKVLILGAGLSGITAAKTLSDRGETDFVILEGSNKIGGRIRNWKIGNHFIEAGATWISSLGADGEILQLGNKYNVTYRTQEYEDYTFRDTQGNDVTDEADERYDAFSSALENAEKLSRAMNIDKKETTWRESNAKAALSRFGWKASSPVDLSIEYWDFEFVYANPSELVSTVYLGFPYYGDSYVEYITVDQNGGFEKIVTGQAEEFLAQNDSRLVLDATVSKIIYGDDFVTVETKDGRTFSADYAIVTFSLGVLKHPTAVTFQPTLPDWKLDAISQQTMANYAEVVVRFDESVQPFWGSSEWALFAQERRGHFTLMHNFNLDFPGSNLLSFCLIGDELLNVIKMSDDEIKEEIRNVLSQVYNQSIPEIADIIVPRWATDPLFYGTYSDWSVAYSNRVHDALKSRIGRVHFGGEATDREWFGFTNGAFRSGKRVANEVLQCIQGTKDCPIFDPSPLNEGCTYKQAENFDAEADVDDGSCDFKN